MLANVTFATELCLDGKVFNEGFDICFVKGGIKYIAQIVQIVPEIGNHPISLICDNVTVVKGEDTFKTSSIEGVALVFYVDDFEKVDYVYVD